MSPLLDDLLCQRYPVLFAQRHGSPQETGLCWGFACGDGWFLLVDAFCEEVQRLVDDHEVPPVVVTQVKSKMGSLRIHFLGGDNRVRAMADLVRTLSERIDQETLPRCGRWGWRCRYC